MWKLVSIVSCICHRSISIKISQIVRKHQAGVSSLYVMISHSQRYTKTVSLINVRIVGMQFWRVLHYNEQVDTLTEIHLWWIQFTNRFIHLDLSYEMTEYTFNKRIVVKAKMSSNKWNMPKKTTKLKFNQIWRLINKSNYYSTENVRTRYKVTTTKQLREMRGYWLTV